MSKPNKKGGIINKNKLKDSRDKWKNKAVFRNQEVYRLKKRVAELHKSREAWKSKYQSSQSKLSSSGMDLSSIPPAAHGHQYSILWVLLCIHWQKYGQMSLRACQHCLQELWLCIGLHISAPSHESIRQWVCKSGYYHSQPIEDCGTWALIVDESVFLGGEKILLVLGIRLDSWGFERCLDISSTCVLHISTSQSWSGKEIAQKLQDISAQRQVAYVVSDQGNNLLKACREGGFAQVGDCSHMMAKGLEYQYKGLAVF